MHYVNRSEIFFKYLVTLGAAANSAGDMAAAAT
jgi:hypothetical protein